MFVFGLTLLISVLKDVSSDQEEEAVVQIISLPLFLGNFQTPATIICAIRLPLLPIQILLGQNQSFLKKQKTYTFVYSSRL